MTEPPNSQFIYDQQQQQQLIVDPLNTTQQLQKPALAANTFVHKLYNMVVDNQYQHLIAWSYTGSSFIVCNITEFSRDVLPKHFKHNNFSSFVRQLNMYGFHKVNKSPRGHRTLAENQIWEFSHPKFIRNRSDLLDDIKRKTMESDTARKDTRDLHSHMTMMQVSHSDMMQRISHLFENFNELIKELNETKKQIAKQEENMEAMLQYIAQRNGGQLPVQFHSHLAKENDKQPPSIFITSPDPSSHTPGNPGLRSQMMSDMYGRAPPLTVRTQNLGHEPTRSSLIPPGNGLHSPMSFGTFGNTLPPSPGPSSMISDDDTSLHSPHSPYTPRSSISHSSPAHMANTLEQPTTPRPLSSSDANPHLHPEFAFVNTFDTLSHR